MNEAIESSNRAKPAELDTVLRAMVLSSEALITRHIEILGREPNSEQDYEVFELRETITDAKASLANNRKERNDGTTDRKS